MIIVPSGTPAQPDLFKNRCLPVAFVIGKMIAEAAYKGDKVVKNVLKELKSLSQLTRVSNQKKNAIGEKIWRITQAALDDICTTSIGPHSYDCLNDLCRKYNFQCIVFSGLLAQPLYFFPLDQAEPRPDLPSIFLQEVVSLNTNSKTQYHIDVIIRPELVYSKKFACQLCFQVVSNKSQHKLCSRRKSCWYCGRKKLQPGDWYDSLMARKFCPSALKNHPGIEYHNKACPNCQEEIATLCCFKKHKPNCNGKTRCKSCFQIIAAFKGEKLEDKVAKHQCSIRKCLICFEDINLSEAKTHCCKLKSVSFPRGYPPKVFLMLRRLKR